MFHVERLAEALRGWEDGLRGPNPTTIVGVLRLESRSRVAGEWVGETGRRRGRGGAMGARSREASIVANDRNLSTTGVPRGTSQPAGDGFAHAALVEPGPRRRNNGRARRVQRHLVSRARDRGPTRLGHSRSRRRRPLHALHGRAVHESRSQRAAGSGGTSRPQAGTGRGRHRSTYGPQCNAVGRQGSLARAQPRPCGPALPAGSGGRYRLPVKKPRPSCPPRT